MILRDYSLTLNEELCEYLSDPDANKHNAGWMMASASWGGSWGRINADELAERLVDRTEGGLFKDGDPVSDDAEEIFYKERSAYKALADNITVNQ